MARRYPIILAAIYFVLWTVLAINPGKRADWALENLLVVIAIPVSIFLYRRGALSNLSWTLIFIFMTLHAFGAHYTYSKVPLGDYAAGWFGWKRNHYDRLVHFSYGLMLSWPVFELLSAKIKGHLFMRLFLAFCVIAACGAVYELMEWAVALVVKPDARNAFLGSQGDKWDAQKDIALKLLGSTLSLSLLTASGKHRSAPISHKRPVKPDVYRGLRTSGVA